MKRDLIAEHYFDSEDGVDQIAEAHNTFNDRTH